MSAASHSPPSSSAWPGRLAVGLVGITYVLLVFGSTVRVHGAGLACPDWPLCFGQAIPQLNFQVFLEWGHRVLAGGISLVFLGLLLRILSDSALRAKAGLLGLLAAVALVTQVVLGGLTVLELLAEWTVTSHLLVGNTFCALLLLLSRRLGGWAPSPRAAPVGRLARLAAPALLVLVGAQLALGGLVASSHAGLACGPSFPTCAGSSLAPSFTGLVGLQVMHRIVALLLLLGALAVALLLRRSAAGPAALGALLLIAAQAVLGIANVLLQLPVEITILHSAGAAAVVLCTTWLCDVALRAPVARGERCAPALRSGLVEAK